MCTVGTISIGLVPSRWMLSLSLSMTERKGDGRKLKESLKLPEIHLKHLPTFTHILVKTPRACCPIMEV